MPNPYRRALKELIDEEATVYVADLPQAIKGVVREVDTEDCEDGFLISQPDGKGSTTMVFIDLDDVRGVGREEVDTDFG